MGGILFLNSNQSKSLPLVHLGNFPQKRFPPLLRPQPAMEGDNLGVGLNTRPPTTTNEEAMKTASRGRGEETTLAHGRIGWEAKQASSPSSLFPPRSPSFYALQGRPPTCRDPNCGPNRTGGRQCIATYRQYRHPHPSPGC